MNEIINKTFIDRTQEYVKAKRDTGNKTEDHTLALGFVLPTLLMFIYILFKDPEIVLGTTIILLLVLVILSSVYIIADEI